MSEVSLWPMGCQQEAAHSSHSGDWGRCVLRTDCKGFVHRGTFPGASPLWGGGAEIGEPEVMVTWDLLIEGGSLPINHWGSARFPYLRTFAFPVVPFLWGWGEDNSDFGRAVEALRDDSGMT